MKVHSFDFFRYGLTEVYSTAPSLAQLKGRQYQSLGQAAQEIHVHIYGKDRGVVSHGEQFEVPFSPELLTTFCVTEPDSLAPGG
ncbi:hypothetical protein Ctob_014886, partial [Chrysochromulina tobinii]